jgi:hypothetical protein
MLRSTRSKLSIWCAIWIAVYPNFIVASVAPQPKFAKPTILLQSNLIARSGDLHPKLDQSSLLDLSKFNNATSVKSQLSQIVSELNPQQLSELNRAIKRLVDKYQDSRPKVDIALLVEMASTLDEMGVHNSHTHFVMMNPGIAAIPFGPPGVIVGVTIIVGTVVIGIILMGAADELAERMWDLQQQVDILKDWLAETDWLMRDLVSRGIYDGLEMERLQDLYNEIVWEISYYKEEMARLLDEYYPPE